MKTTYYGHSCFGIETNGSHLLIDPFISGNPLAAHINIDAIKANYIIISHGHYDHILDAERIAKNTGAKIIANFEIINWFKNKGFENVHAMNCGGKTKFDFGTIKCVTAVNSSSLPDGSYGGTACGFVITHRYSSKSIYYAGDTALHSDMRLIGDEFEINAAFLPIGDNYTMGISDAIRCAEFVGTHKIIGMHFDTFPAIQINHEEAISTFRQIGKNLILPKIGDNIML